MSSALLHAYESVDQSPGLTRRVLTTEDGRPFRLHLDYHSRRNAYARLGDIYQGRVTAKEPGGGGVFVELGYRPAGLLRSRSAPAEGALCVVRVASEARQEKGPVLSLHSLAANAARPSDTGAVQAASPDPFLAGVEPICEPTDVSGRQLADEALDAALATHWPLPSGGALSIERTSALTAIDVDAGGRLSRGDRSNFATTVNLEAAEEIARAISLKSLGGLVVVDLLKLVRDDHKRSVENAFVQSLRTYLGRKCEVGRISRFGLLEISIQHGFEPISEVAARISPEEHRALDILSDVQRAGLNDRGGRIEAILSPEVSAWLESTEVDWREQLEKAIGPRFKFTVSEQTLLGSETITCR